MSAYKVFFQPPIFDIRIDNLIHKGDRISQPSEYSTNISYSWIDNQFIRAIAFFNPPSNIPPTLYYAPENFALGG
ncbi:hypothetical protein FHK94_12405 [Cylindrospermopsis raciborskii CS-506_D]|uniref:Uncharacterized protein n=1 Tax=Cylindrospermopsis raciborskii CS-506_A TaxID=2585140 RepID=A0A838WKB2_9CYAN|nr:hypothetical protein [Cylindrospermopsis raciborskii]MBA4450335.1 hypothetical protein [Cylindrospermopsis raciborskii CS-506_D]MBA4466314.1 hypothetical protein [Cylindrospermopsis raciborskii CS-506_A]